MQALVVINPYSRKNRSHPMWAARLRQIFGATALVRVTRSPQELQQAIVEGIDNRVDCWVIDGGDGTLHCTLKAVLDLQRANNLSPQQLPPLFMTGRGTVNFVAKHTGKVNHPMWRLRRLAHMLDRGHLPGVVPIRSMDITMAKTVGDRRIEDRVLGFAAAAGGAGQRFFELYYDQPKRSQLEVARLMGKILVSAKLGFLPHVDSQLARQAFAPTSARVTVDAEVLAERQFRSLNIASMSINLANVLRLFSDASRTGTLHAIVGDPSVAVMIQNLPNAILGRGIGGDGLRELRCEQMCVDATSEQGLSPVVDGELYQGYEQLRFCLGPTLRFLKL